VRRILSGRERWRLLVEEGSLWKKSVGKQVTTTGGGSPLPSAGEQTIYLVERFGRFGGGMRGGRGLDSTSFC
jgi:hypothetical protein